MRNQFICHFLIWAHIQRSLNRNYCAYCLNNFLTQNLLLYFLINLLLAPFLIIKMHVLPLRLRLSLVYKFNCARCASEYVGMTSRTLGSRVDEHIGVSSSTGARLTCPSHSAIRDHAMCVTLE